MDDRSPQSPERAYKMSLVKLRRAINQIKEVTRDVTNSGKLLVSRAGVARMLTMSVCGGHRLWLYAKGWLLPTRNLYELLL